MLAGFPSHPFSIAGVSRKNSLSTKHRFIDETQGALFYDIVRILKAKRPKAFLLENVKNLKSYAKGGTFKIISGVRRELDYITFYQIIDAKHYVPQHRERIFIAGFNREHYNDSVIFKFPETPKKEIRVRDILLKNPDPKYTLTDHLWNYLQNYAKKHKEKGNGFGFGLVDLDSVSRTLSARHHKDGSEILIPQDNGRNPRRLTPEECRALMGYSNNFKIKGIGGSDMQLYRQFGNSVVVPVVLDIAKKMIVFIDKNITAQKQFLESHI